MDFSAYIMQSSTNLSDGTVSLDSDAFALGFIVLDVPPDLPIQIGLGAGYTGVSQQLPESSGSTDLGGAYVNLVGRSEFQISEPVSAFLTLAYTYLSVQGSKNDQNTTLRWNHFFAELKFAYQFSRFFTVDLGGVIGTINAKLSTEGDANDSLSLKSDSNVAGLVGLKYHLDPEQYLGLRYQHGYTRELIIQFQRTFY